MSRRGLLSLSVLGLIILMIYCTWSRAEMFVKQTPPQLAPAVQKTVQIPSLEQLEVVSEPTYSNFIFEKNTETTSLSGLFASSEQVSEIFGSTDIAKGEISIDENIKTSPWSGFMQVLVPLVREKFNHAKVSYAEHKLTLEGEVKDADTMSELNMLIDNAGFEVENLSTVMHVLKPEIAAVPEIVPEPVAIPEADVEPNIEVKKEVNTTILGLNKLVDIYKEENPEKAVGDNSLEELQALVKSTQILFPYNSDKPHTDQRPAVMRMVQLLEANPDVNINIVGSTDTKGNAAYNMRLSKKRAEQIVHCIASLGISKERLHATWIGKDAHTQVDAAKKRKVEFSIASSEEVKKKTSSVRIGFTKNSAKIQKNDKAKLDILVAKLQTNKDLKLNVLGYTDSRGSKAYNLALSQKRAKNVAMYLIKAGIQSERIEAKGYGINTKYNNTRDRRVEFEILGE